MEFPFTLNEPRTLLLLAALIPVIAIGLLGVRARPRDRGRIATGTLLRALIITLVVLALAGMQWIATGGPLNVVFVIDESASVSQESRDAARDYVRREIAAKGPDASVGVVRFGQAAVVDRAISGGSAWEPGSNAPSAVATDIASALEVAVALFPEEGNRRIILLSDGRETAGDAIASARRAGLSQVEISVVPLQARGGNEVAVLEVGSSVEIPAGQSHEVRVLVHSAIARAGTVTLTDNGVPAGRQDVQLKSGRNVVTFNVETREQGFHTYEARVNAAEDGFAQNNVASSFTVVKRPPQVLIIANAGEDSAPLVAALASSAVQARVVPPEGLPRRLATLAEYDAVVLANVSAESLTVEGQEVLETYVRDLGHGLVMLGGERAYGAGGYLYSPLERVLPVSMDVRASEERGSLAMTFLLDKSGSMGRCHCGGAEQFDPSMRTEFGVSKIEIAKQAISKAVDLLKPTDLVGVIGFDLEAHWLSALGPLGGDGAPGLKRSLQPVIATGETNIYAGLQTAIDSLKTADVQLRHIVLIGDGWSKQGDFTGLLDQMAENNISLTTVGAGEGPGALMQDLAERGGGEYYRATDVTSLPDILLKETVRLVGAYYVEQPTEAIRVKDHPILRGLETSLPDLLGYNAATLKSSAEGILSAPNGDPLLAQWQYGLGRSVAWLSDNKGRWARDWVQWPGFGQFMGQLVGWSFPRDATPGLAVTFNLSDSVSETRDVAVRVESTDAEGTPRNGLYTSLVITSSTGITSQVPIVQEAPGVYAGVAGNLQTGVYQARIVQQDTSSGTTIAAQSSGLTVPYESEYLPNETGDADSRQLLADIAMLGKGRMLSTAEQGSAFGAVSLDQPRRVRLWPWLLFVAILLFPLDVALRRLTVSWRDLFGRGSKPRTG